MGSYIVQVSEEEMAEIEAATKQLLDTRGGNLLKILIAAATLNFLFRRFIRNISCICTGKALEIVLSSAVKKPRSRVSPPTSPAAPPTQVWLLHDCWHCSFPSRWGAGEGYCWSEQAPLSYHDQTIPISPIILILRAIGTFDRKYLPPLNFTSKQSSSQESIEQKLKEAEERKKSIETERLDWKTFMTRQQIFSYIVIILFSG